MDIKMVESDFLIIGGGSAGCMAAIRALELDSSLKVTIFEKGDLKYGGSIARGMDALNIVAIPGLTDPDLYVEAVTIGCEGIADAEPSRLMAERSFGLMKKLEDWGVRFIKNVDGEYRTLQYHVKGRFQVAMDEPDLKVMIAKKAQDLGAESVNRVMGIRLLKNDDRIAGAIGVHVRTGELIACKAKSVLVCAGGLSRFSLPNSGYMYGLFDFPGNTGDGFIMGLDAGADITGMEFCHTGNIVKDANMPLLAITVTRGAKLLDIHDNVIMEGAVKGLNEMNKAFYEGRGPLRIQLSHLPEETIKEIEDILFSTERPVQERFFKNRGIDFREKDIELWSTESQLCGGHGISGMRIDKTAQTSVHGLYAAGDVAAVPMQHLTGAFVFGEIAAESTVDKKAKDAPVEWDMETIDAVRQDHKARYATSGRALDVREIEYKVRRLIGDYVISPKNGFKLKRWLEWSPQLLRELREEAIAEDGFELSKSYEIENIIRCSDCSALASLTRKESRWGQAHLRSDYPDRDDNNWLKHIIIRKGEGVNGLTAITKPVLDLDGEILKEAPVHVD